MDDDEVTPLTTTTTNYGWVKPDVGASDDAWGGMLNADLDGIDSTVKGVSNAIPVASSTTPLMDGVAAIGTGTTWARADHAHPSDTTKLSLTGGALTGALTPSTTAGLVGTPLGDNANAGAVGEVISSNVVSPGVTLTSTVAANVTSIALTAGDWDVTGEIWFVVGAGGATILISGIGSASATLSPSGINTSRSTLQIAFGAGTSHAFPLRPCRVSLAAPATYYLVANSTFPSGTTTAYGNIWARRAR